MRLQLLSLRVTASVDPVVAADGSLGVPDDPATVGWWTGSVLPGSRAGATVVDGHVDSAATGPGALYQLQRLAAGDRIRLQLAGAGAMTYSVTARRTYLKDTGLPASLFTRAGPPHLVLISCGGQFDETTRSYDSNVVVLARPVP